MPFQKEFPYLDFFNPIEKKQDNLGSFYPGPFLDYN